eukprot:3656210-Pleurochrysis_carterae.AAC.1
MSMHVIITTKYNTAVKNGAEELDCRVVVDLEGQKLDASLPECVEADVHAGANRISLKYDKPSSKFQFACICQALKHVALNRSGGAVYPLTILVLKVLRRCVRRGKP